MAFSRLHTSFFQAQRRAFSLTELLVTLLVTGIIMGAVLGAMALFLSNFQFVSSGVSARQRTEMVLSVLAKPIQHAGLGMPVTSDDFQTAFDQVYSAGVTVHEYPSALHINNSGELHVVYGEPTGLSLLSPEDLEVGSLEQVLIQLNGPPLGITVNDWVVFPTGTSPLLVKSVFGNSMTIENRGDPTSISRLDELHRVRFLRGFCEDGVFHAIDPRAGTVEGVSIEGIDDLSAVFFEDERVIRVTIVGYGKEGSREDVEEINASWRVKNL